MTSSSGPQSESSAATAIRLVLWKIASGSSHGLDEVLPRLPVSVVPPAQSETLINLFLTECMKYSNTAATRYIIDFFDVSRARVDPLPALSQLLLNSSLSRDLLMFCISCFPEKRPLDFYVDLVNMPDDVGAIKAAAVLNEIFPDVSSDDWVTLYHLTDSDPDDPDYEYPNPMLRSFFETKASESGVCPSKPEWVRDYPEVEIPPVPDTIPSVKEAVDLLLEDLAKQKIEFVAEDDSDAGSIQRIKEQLISQYSISTISEKIQMLAPVKQIPPFDDTPIFREFGPVNTIYTVCDSPPDPTHPCSQNGGCRMLTCTEFEHLTSDGEPIDIMAIDEYNDFDELSTFEYTPYGSTEKVVETISITAVGAPVSRVEWFRKACDICHTPISHKHHAVRKPLPQGGWFGCYCAPCLKSTVTNPNEAILVGRVQEQLSVIGIRDRS